MWKVESPQCFWFYVQVWVNCVILQPSHFLLSKNNPWWVPQFGKKNQSYSILRWWFAKQTNKKPQRPLTKIKSKKVLINLNLWFLRTFLKLWNFHLPESQLSPKTVSRGWFRSPRSWLLAYCAAADSANLVSIKRGVLSLCVLCGCVNLPPMSNCLSTKGGGWGFGGRVGKAWLFLSHSNWCVHFSSHVSYKNQDGWAPGGL